MKIQKFFSLVLSVFILLISVVLANNYSQELQDAYQFAYQNKITTQDSIDKADMYGGLTRIAMAKMLSQYAINILGKSPDTSKIANFGDVNSKLDGDYNNGVTLAYQLGIMGVGIDKFRPFDSVTRAEFGTALSRVLYGDTYNQNGDNYYSNHLNALKNAGIMTKIDNPSQKEIRGYVMLMLMRSVFQSNDNSSSSSDSSNTTQEVAQQYENQFEGFKDNYSDIISIQSIRPAKDNGDWTLKGELRTYDKTHGYFNGYNQSYYNGDFENMKLAKCYNKCRKMIGDEIRFYKHTPNNKQVDDVTLLFKTIGNIQKEQIKYITFIIGHANLRGAYTKYRAQTYKWEDILNGEIRVFLPKDSYSIVREIRYNNVESGGTTIGLELNKILYENTAKNIKRGGEIENMYIVPKYSSREINISPDDNGKNDTSGHRFYYSKIDFVTRGTHRFSSNMKGKFHNIGAFKIEHGTGSENAYLKEIFLNYSGDIGFFEAISDLKICSESCSCDKKWEIPITYTVSNGNDILINISNRTDKTSFVICAKFKDLIYVGDHNIKLRVTGAENFKMEMEDGRKPFYNKFELKGFSTDTKGRDKYKYEKEFGELPNISNGSDESYSSSDDYDDSSSSDDTTDDSNNEGSDSSNNENNNPEDSENCAYVKIDNGTSYCFNITKVSGSKFGMSINNGDSGGVYGCSIARADGTNIGVFNSCSYSEFTILPSSGVHDFRIKLSYDGKQYSRKVSYDLTNGIFVNN